MEARTLVAWNVRRLRVAKGLSQEALAAEAELDRTYVSGLERGVGNPTVAVLERLARVLGVHVSCLFQEPEAGSTRPTPLRGGRKAVSKNGP